MDKKNNFVQKNKEKLPLNFVDIEFQPDNDKIFTGKQVNIEIYNTKSFPINKFYKDVTRFV